MTFTKKDIKFLIPFGIFITIGMYGSTSVDFLVSSPTFDKTFKWCGIPTLFLSLYYAYRATFGYPNQIALWRNSLNFIVITFLTLIMFFVSIQGILVLTNCKIGEQKEFLLTGRITKLHYPKKKKVFEKYTIEIERKAKGDLIKLDVPTNEYSQGQLFSKKMKIGSLGFIYLDE